MFKTTKCTDTGEVCYSYQDYLRSEHWANLKRRYRHSKLEKCCFVCGATDRPIEFHHRTYKRIGAEWLQDIVPLCRGCHELTHSKGGATYKKHKKARSHVKKMARKADRKSNGSADYGGGVSKKRRKKRVQRVDKLRSEVSKTLPKRTKKPQTDIYSEFASEINELLS